MHQKLWSDNKIVLQRIWITLSMFTKKEERCKNDYLCFYLKKQEMIPILGGDGKTSQPIFVRFDNCETKPGNDHSGKETNFSFRSETLMTDMQNSIRNNSKSNL